MKRLLTTTTALSMALGPFHTMPAFAQTAITVGDQVVICLPDETAVCPEGAICVVAPEAPCDEATVAAAVAAEQAAAEAAVAEQAAAEAAAAEQAAAEAAVAEAAVAEAAVAEQAAAEAAVAEQAAAEAAAAEQAAAEAAAVEKAAADAVDEAVVEPTEPMTEEPVVEPTEKVTEEPAVEPTEEVTAEPAIEPNGEVTEEPAVEPTGEVTEEPAVEPTGEVTEEPAVEPTGEVTEEPAVEVPLLAPAEGLEVPSEEAVTSLTDILSETPEDADVPIAPAAAEVETEVTAEAAASSVITEVTEEESRSSAEDFPKVPQIISDPAKPAVQPERKGLSDFEKFGLVVLGALVVGAILNNGDEVVSNTGDRVVVRRDDGRYVVLKDDDTLIRRPGSRVATETFDDGSTRTVVEREDGSRIVTIRDASGRVLRRARVNVDGSQTLLIDDLAPVERIDIAKLPKPKPGRLVISTQDDDAALQAALLAQQTSDLGRVFSLRQVREYPQVRALAPTIDVESVTFDTGSAAIKPSEAKKLARLGRLMTNLIDENPAEMFLIEGHTDAVGSAYSNLALSDRRAESLALALSEYFEVPPENLVVQGYGESELRIDTQGPEARNRRASVRMISPLLEDLALR